MTDYAPPPAADSPAADAPAAGSPAPGAGPTGSATSAGPTGSAPGAQASSTPSPPATRATPSRGALAAITIAAAIIGGGALVTVGGTSALAAIGQVAAGDGAVGTTTTVDTAGVTVLKVEVGRGSAAIRFADVTAATMRATGTRNSDWSMHREGDVLRVDRPTAPFGWWIGGWFGQDPQMTLTLPREVEGELNADLQLDAGSLSTEGRFGTLAATVNAGSLSVDGGAPSVTTRVRAGSATLRLDDVTTADLDMSAGDLNATITGAQPDAIRLNVSAGSMDVAVPSGRYALSKDVSAGNLETSIQTDLSSSHHIQASLSAGGITLREGS